MKPKPRVVQFLAVQQLSVSLLRVEGLQEQVQEDVGDAGNFLRKPEDQLEEQALICPFVLNSIVEGEVVLVVGEALFIRHEFGLFLGDFREVRIESEVVEFEVFLVVQVEHEVRDVVLSVFEVDGRVQHPLVDEGDPVLGELVSQNARLASEDFDLVVEDLLVGLVWGRAEEEEEKSLKSNSLHYFLIN